ncbi:MAG: hypothetical protein SGJ21_11755 [Alphaproteobacteria bacterium]|nr:hypothetical protein [Alphaproteobacteria bacterium]
MSIDAAGLRDAAARYREAAREVSAASFAERAQSRRDQRVEEARDPVAARPDARDRPALARAPDPYRLLDILT